MWKRRILGITVFGLLSPLFPGVAFAYLDPGTGSMIIQGVLAAVAAVGVSLGVFWKRLKTLFGAKKSGPAERDGDEN